jgi:drug/metabolite transporter (DMT)-like permease
LKNTRLLTQIALLFAFVMWGSDGVFLKVMNLPVTTIIFVDGVIAFVVLLPVVLITGSYKAFANPRRAAMMIAVGFVHTAVILALYSSLQMTSVSNAMLSHYMGPVFVFLLAPFVLNEKRTRIFGLGLGISVIGLAVLLSSGGFSLSNSDVIGIGVGVLSALFYGTNIVLLKRIMSTCPPLAVAFSTFVCDIIVTAPLMLLDPGQIGAASQYGWLFIVKVALTAVFPFVIYTNCIKALEAQRVSILGYIEPVAAMLMAWVFLAELPGWQTFVGGAMILGAGAWIIIDDARRTGQASIEVPGVAVT